MDKRTFVPLSLIQKMTGGDTILTEAFRKLLEQAMETSPSDIQELQNIVSDSSSVALSKRTKELSTLIEETNGAVNSALLRAKIYPRELDDNCSSLSVLQARVSKLEKELSEIRDLTGA